VEISLNETEAMHRFSIDPTTDLNAYNFAMTFANDHKVTIIEGSASGGSGNSLGNGFNVSSTTEFYLFTQKSGQSSLADRMPTNISAIELRWSFLMALNFSLAPALALIDLSKCSEAGSVGALLSACRGLIFECMKNPYWETYLAKTAGSGGRFDLAVSRSRARKYSALGKPDHDGRWSVFGQAFRIMHPMPPSTLRREDQLYTTGMCMWRMFFFLMICFFLTAILTNFHH